MYKVLLVEDEDIIRKGLMFMVNWQEINCVVVGEAIDGVDGIQKIKDNEPDIVIVDINMPIMNGIEFLKTVKNDDQLKRIPVVVLTTSEEQQDKVNSFNLGVAGYMAKPVDYRQFVEVMRSIDAYWTISEMP